MPQILSDKDIQFGRFVSEEPDGGIIAVYLLDGVTKQNLLEADPATGDVTYSTPHATLAGRHMFDAEVYANGVNVREWGSILNKPATFTPSSHEHPWAEITGEPTTLAGYGITDAASSSHNHAIDALSNVTITARATGDLLRWGGSAWVNYPDSNFAAAGHAHTFASLTSKPTTLAGYGITDAAVSGHTHAFADLTAKPTTLSGYGITDAAEAGHTHVAADIASGSFGIGRGGTGLTTVTKGALLHASAIDTWAALPVSGTDGYVLTANSTTGLPEWRSVPTAGSANGVSSTTDAAIQADSDASGGGEIQFKIGATTWAAITNGGALTTIGAAAFGGAVQTNTAFYLGAIPASVTGGNARAIRVAATFPTTAVGSVMVFEAAPTLAAGLATTGTYGLMVRDPVKGVGATTTDNFGIYISTLAAGTNNYSIYTGTAQSYFGGNVSVIGNTVLGGSTDAGYKLDVQGTGRFTGLVSAATGVHLTTDVGFVTSQPGIFRTAVHGTVLMGSVGSSFGLSLYTSGGQAILTNANGTLNLKAYGSLEVTSNLLLNGTTVALNPAANVNVTGSASVANGLTFGTSVLTVDFANNRVGIGNAAPTVKLDVTGDARVSGISTVVAASGVAIGTAQALLRVSENAAPARGIRLGFDTASNAGVIAASGDSVTEQNIAFWTYNGSAWGARMTLSGVGVLSLTNTLSGRDFYATRSAATEEAFQCTVSGDPVDERFTIYADGKHQWGPGTAARDVTLARSGAGVLAITGALDVSSNLAVSGKLTLGAPAATGFSTSGDIQMANGRSIWMSQNSGTGNVKAFTVNTSDQIALGNSSFGVVAEAYLVVGGTVNAGYKLDVQGTARFTGAVSWTTATSGTSGSIYKQTTDGLVIWGVTGSSYDFALLNNSGSYVMRVLAGSVTTEFLGDVNTATAFKRGGTQVVGARKTGWSTPTGTATRTAFATGSVTLPQLAERVKALIDDLHGTAGHGLIGT